MQGLTSLMLKTSLWCVDRAGVAVCIQGWWHRDGEHRFGAVITVFQNPGSKAASGETAGVCCKLSSRTNSRGCFPGLSYSRKKQLSNFPDAFYLVSFIFEQPHAGGLGSTVQSWQEQHILLGESQEQLLQFSSVRSRLTQKWHPTKSKQPSATLVPVWSPLPSHGAGTARSLLVKGLP